MGSLVWEPIFHKNTIIYTFYFAISQIFTTFAR